MQITTEECFSNEFSFVLRIKLPRLEDLFCYGNGLFLAKHNGDVTLITKANCKAIHVFDFWTRFCCFSLHLEKFQRKILAKKILAKLSNGFSSESAGIVI